MNRRTFINSGIGASLLGLMPNLAVAHLKNTTIMPDELKPPRLQKGDVVGLIAPGYLITEEQLEETKKYVTELGFIPYHTDTILKKYGYLAGTDKERVDDINEMFKNPEVKAIFCARGGYGCTRILNAIDFEAIRNNPKILLGFSDVTALLNTIHQETGLITFHGPVGTTLNDDYSNAILKNIIENPAHRLLIESSDEDLQKAVDNPEYERYTITPGKVEGKLVGGNLCLIAAMIGTKYQIDFKDAIVCIEDVEEEPYRIDRMLTQLIETGELAKASGIALGIFNGCNVSKNKNSFSLKEVILDRVKPMNIPAVYGLSFGHNKKNFTIPIGLHATLDTDKMTIKLRGRAVV
jgi:muramoyltetrapeptide carboxypeptidase